MQNERLKHLIALFALVLFTSCNYTDEPDRLFSGEDSTLKELQDIMDDNQRYLADVKVGEEEIFRLAGIIGQSELIGKKSASRAKDFIVAKLSNNRVNVPIYVVNYAEEGGFVLLSGTKTYHPVLAYSDHGHYDADEEKPGGLKIWEDESFAAMKWSESQPIETLKKFQVMWANLESLLKGESSKGKAKKIQTGVNDFDPGVAWMNQVDAWLMAGYVVYPITQAEITGNSAIDERFRYSAQQSIYPLYEEDWENYSAVVMKPYNNVQFKDNLISTNWYQYSSFNDSCFTSSGQQALVGCGPVAIGQVMRYFQYPSSYNWSNMPNNYSTPTTAQFLHDVGVTANVSYGVNATSMALNKVIPTLQNYGYVANQGSHSYERTKGCLALNRPVILSGILHNQDGTSQGHLWIASGYRQTNTHVSYEVYTINNSTTIGVVDSYDTYFTETKYLYMNWGWGYQYNAWYLDNSLYVSDLVSSVTGRKSFYDIHPNN